MWHGSARTGSLLGDLARINGPGCAQRKAVAPGERDDLVEERRDRFGRPDRIAGDEHGAGHDAVAGRRGRRP